MRKIAFHFESRGIPKSRRSVTARTEGGLDSTVQLLYICDTARKDIYK